MALITKTNTFVGGTTAVAAQVNTNFDTIYNDYNGNITNANISGAAAIAESKLNLDGSKCVLVTTAQTVAGVKTFSSFPVTPSSAPTTDYQVANKKYVDDTATTQDIIGRGFEITYKTTADLYVEPGTLWVGNTKVNKTARTTLTLATNGDWIDGSAPALANIWIYVYAKSDGSIKLDENVPNYADTSGNNVGQLIYYRDAALAYWRVIAAVRTDGANQIKKFWRDRDIYFYDVIQEATTTASEAAWTALSLANYIPVGISKNVILKIHAQRSNQGEVGVWVRPTGATWSTNDNDSLYDECASFQNYLSNGAGLGSQYQMLTSSAGSVDYRTNAANSVFRIGVMGWIVTTR